MNPSEVPPDQPNIWYDPKQAYIQMLVDSFCFCLSPQELPRSMTARLYMDEELWMPIRVLAKLPALDNLLISDVMFPFVTQSLYNCASHYLEVDVTREIVRPKWALRSSVFISNVDMYATADQIFDLLEDLRSSVTHPNNPFEFDNISISKQTANSWSISFKSPSAGPYAAMSMKSKCINGSLVLPMACVHINPPRATYSNMDIVVMEVDAIQYGDPAIPIGYLQYYSENPAHINLLYNTSAMNRQEPTYNEYFRGPGTVPFIPPAIRERSYSNQSFCTQQSVGKGNDVDGDSSVQTPQTCDQFEYGSYSSADLDALSTQGETKNEAKSIIQNNVASPQSDRGTTKQERQCDVNPNEGTLGKQPQPTEKMPNPTPSNEASHDAAAKVTDSIEPMGVVKTGEQTGPSKSVSAPETKLHPLGAEETAETWHNMTVNPSEDAEGSWNDVVENGSTISYPEPESLHTPSFAKQVDLETSSSRERNEKKKQKQAVVPRRNQSTQTFRNFNPNPRHSADPDGARGTPKERNEWRDNNHREDSGERHNGKGRSRQSPHGRKKHLRKGSGGSPRGERNRENSSNGFGPRRRNGQNRKSGNRDQRFKTENQQHSSNNDVESRNFHQDPFNAMHTDVSEDANFPSGQQTRTRDEDWQTISYKRLGSRRSQSHRSYSAHERNGRNGGGKNGNRRDERLRSSSSHSFS